MDKVEVRVRSRANHLKGFWDFTLKSKVLGLQPGIQGQNLVVAVLYVPSLLDSGKGVGSRVNQEYHRPSVVLGESVHLADILSGLLLLFITLKPRVEWYKSL